MNKLTFAAFERYVVHDFHPRNIQFIFGLSKIAYHSKISFTTMSRSFRQIMNVALNKDTNV